MFGQFEKSVYLCTRKSDNEELNGSVAQLNRASDYGSEGCGFESRRNHKGERYMPLSLLYMRLWSIKEAPNRFGSFLYYPDTIFYLFFLI